MSEDEDKRGPEEADRPSQPTEEYLLGGIDEAMPADGESVSLPPAAEPAAPADPEPAAAVHPEDQLNPPTEEMFAAEARLRGSGDSPELDPVFRAALLESPESGAAAEPPPTDGSVEPINEPPTAESEFDGPATAEETDESPFPITEEQTAILAAAAKSEVHEAIEAARRTGQPFDPARPPRSGDFEPPSKGQRYWWRFALATLIIVFSFAGATSASVLNVFDDLTARVSDPSFGNLSEKILPSSNGGPQTIAIIGSDVRTGGGSPVDDPGRSDTTILLRLDPDTGQIAMLSIPRDLKVEIPGFGTDKFNAAYSYGGTKLTLQTIKQLTGLQMNHVVNVDFQGFASVVDAIGCVFVDVDRQYFNDNSGLSVAEQYAEIDIGSGYQKLCGPDALEFARYRHTDTDLVRASRQQDLLAEVRNRLSFDEIIKRRNELIDAFTENTRSDISGSNESLELLKLLFDSRDARVVEVEFPATLGPSFVTATPNEIQAAVDRFLGFEDTAGPTGSLVEGEGNNQSPQSAKQRAKQRKAAAAAATRAPSKDNDGLIDAVQAGLDQAAAMQAETGARQFPYFYTKRLPSGTIYSEGSRTYFLRDPDKNSHAAYRMVMYAEIDGTLHYFGLQGLRGWTDPPILQSPYEEIKMGDREFRVYTEGDRIRFIAWFEGEDTYWISNSLLLTLENEQMLGMARATKAFTPG